MDITTRNFRVMLEKKWTEGKFVCVGLDPDLEKIPACVKQEAEQFAGVGISMFRLAVTAFCRAIIEKTRDLAGAYKPNSAFFEGFGPDGMKTYAGVVQLIKTLAPDVPIIGDMKRADIGNTNKGYAKAAFCAYDVDAVTVNPYFGGGSLKPFLDYEKMNGPATYKKGDKGVIVLCRTSNPEAAEFQDRPTLVSSGELNEEFSLLAAQGVTTAESMKVAWPMARLDGNSYWVMPLYHWVAIRFAARWSGNGNCALVVGATAPRELEQVRALVGDKMPILCPGVGFQQKDVPLEQQVEQTVNAARNSDGSGLIINVSRSALYASGGADYADAARAEVLKINSLVEKYRG